MKRFLGSLSRRSSSSDSVSEHREDSPEAIITKELTAFCESNGNGAARDTQGTEVVHLPKIVEIAESSPNAAKEAALRIRKYLADPAGTPNSTQYNAIMLTRILVDNPGHTFTRNFDAKFVTTVKELLRAGRDWHVQSYLRQYLDTLEQQRSWDEDLKLLLQMWAKEKTKASRGLIDRFPMNSGNPPPVPPRQSPNQYSPPHQTLPNPEELAARIAEARNSATLLTQFVRSTPPIELEDNDLVKEFLDRCRTGARIIQGFIYSRNPPPDEDTLQTLIQANSEITDAISFQQHEMLKARKLRGSSSPSSSHANSPDSVPVASGANPSPVRGPQSSGPGPAELPSTVMTGGRVPVAPAAPPAAPATATAAPVPTPTATATTAAAPSTSRYEYNAADFEVRNPFADDYATNESSGGHRQDGTDRAR